MAAPRGNADLADFSQFRVLGSKDVTITKDVDSYLVVHERLSGFRSDATFTMKFDDKHAVEIENVKMLRVMKDKCNAHDKFWCEFRLGGTGRDTIMVLRHFKKWVDWTTVRQKFFEKYVFRALRRMDPGCLSAVIGCVSAAEDKHNPKFDAELQSKIYMEDWGHFVDCVDSVVGSGREIWFYKFEHGLKLPAMAHARERILTCINPAVAPVLIQVHVACRFIKNLTDADPIQGYLGLVQTKVLEYIKTLGDIRQGSSATYYYKFCMNRIVHVTAQLQPTSPEKITYMQFYNSAEALIAKLVFPYYILKAFFSDRSAIHSEQVKNALQECDSMLAKADYYARKLLGGGFARMEVVCSWQDLSELDKLIDVNFMREHISKLLDSGCLGEVQYENFLNIVTKRLWNHYDRVCSTPLPTALTEVKEYIKKVFDSLQLINLAINGGTQDINYARVKQLLIDENANTGPDERWRLKPENEWPQLALDGTLLRRIYMKTKNFKQYFEIMLRRLSALPNNSAQSVCEMIILIWADYARLNCGLGHTTHVNVETAFKEATFAEEYRRANIAELRNAGFDTHRRNVARGMHLNSTVFGQLLTSMLMKVDYLTPLLNMLEQVQADYVPEVIVNQQFVNQHNFVRVLADVNQQALPPVAAVAAAAVRAPQPVAGDPPVAGPSGHPPPPPEPMDWQDVDAAPPRRRWDAPSVGALAVFLLNNPQLIGNDNGSFTAISKRMPGRRSLPSVRSYLRKIASNPNHSDWPLFDPTVKEAILTAFQPRCPR